MKRRLAVVLCFVLLLSQWLLSVSWAGTAHPDPRSGNKADYAGTWIINGKTEANTNWTLEIKADGTYKLFNEYQTFEGEYTFLPSPDASTGDRLWLEFDPSLRIELLLENAANGLVDISGQDLIFVRPGNKANTEEADGLGDIRDIDPEEILGEWMLESMVVVAHGFPFEFTAEELLEGTGVKWVVLSLKDNVVWQLSAEHKMAIPIARCRWISYDTFVFKNPVKMEIFQVYTGLIIDSGLMLMTAHPQPEGTDGAMYFTRVYGIVVDEGEGTED